MSIYFAWWAMNAIRLFQVGPKPPTVLWHTDIGNATNDRLVSTGCVGNDKNVVCRITDSHSKWVGGNVSNALCYLNFLMVVYWQYVLIANYRVAMSLSVERIISYAIHIYSKGLRCSECYHRSCFMVRHFTQQPSNASHEPAGWLYSYRRELPRDATQKWISGWQTTTVSWIPRQRIQVPYILVDVS